MLDLVRKFVEIGCASNKSIKQSRILEEAAQIEVPGHFTMNPTTSISKVARLTNIFGGSKV